MSKGVIFFKELSMPFDLITASTYFSSVLIFIPYSDEDIIRLVGDNVSFNVVEKAEDLEGKYLRVKVSLSDIEAVIFDND